MNRKLFSLATVVVVIIAAITISAVARIERAYDNRSDARQSIAPGAHLVIESICPSLEIAEVTVEIVADAPTYLIVIRNNSDVGVHAYQLSMESNDGRDHTRRGEFGGDQTEREIIAPHKTRLIYWPVADATALIRLASANFIDNHDEGEPREVDHLHHHMMHLIEKRGGSAAEIKAAHTSIKMSTLEHVRKTELVVGLREQLARYVNLTPVEEENKDN